MISNEDISEELINVPLEVDLNEAESNILNAKLYDYVNRPEQLNNVSLFNFVKHYIKTRIPKTIPKKQNITYHFPALHKQHKTHHITQKPNNCIPLIVGPNWPRKNDPTNAELYSQMILIVFKPWRCYQNIKNKHFT